ncbi:MAG: peptide-methionine (S)-S-oxide reductase [Verrucomicrobia bacterium]|nr:peptide-methionine (S)-S-oxide reductase [Verrucomicrobiota bacterium]
MKLVTETIYLAGGCLWGVQEFLRYIPGILATEAGRANGSSQSLDGDYDGYAECVKVDFDVDTVSVAQLVEYLFEIIDPYSVDQQGPDVGKKYRTGFYSRDEAHLIEAKRFIESREDTSKISVEVLPLTNYLRSAEAHQDRLHRFPDDACHLPKALLHKYRRA